MTDEEYLSGVEDLRIRQTLLDQEKTRHLQVYLNSQEFRVGDKVYYTPPTARHKPASDELKGFVFNVEPSWFGTGVYYTVCPPTKAGTFPKIDMKACRGSKETLNLRKVEESND